MQFQQLGPYRLGKKIGQGGMGAVYEGAEITSGEAAAIKVLAPGLATEEGFRVRFEAEIESLKKLRHPNIVRLYGYGEQSGILFYAMELVHGTSLDDELRAGRRFDWREVTTIAIRLCRALKHAHDHGVIHRDLKPANLLMTADGDIKLSDFGIARLFGNSRLTTDGGVLGTAEYMAPEQADGRVVTDRCDQYSLGGVLYALLAGRPPFRAKSLVEMLQLQRYAEPEPVTRYAPQTPEELARIIHQMLEKDPARRFANTLILARSLEAMERGLSISASRGGDDFVVATPGEPVVGQSGYSPNLPTLSPTDLAKQAGPEDSGKDDLESTAATMAYAPASDKEPPTPAAETSQTAADRFTKVDQRQKPTADHADDDLPGLFSPQTMLLATALVLLVLAGWYLMRPPSADKLFRQIDAATADGDMNGLKDIQPKIEQFLTNYPDDPRAEQVAALGEESKQGNPIERAYVEAKRLALINPEMAATRLQALVDVYDDGSVAPDATRHFVKLARQKLKQLQKQISRRVEDDRRAVETRMARAQELAADDSAAARKIYAGIVTLYSDKPWAAETVRQAQAALAASSDPDVTAK